MTTKPIFALVLAAIVWGYVVALQRPPPRYSQQYMPQTSFTCRNKIVGSYYADPETDCQLFHVCVSVAGSIQDYRFLCPNDTAFDQESQTCADWYDVDCEAATLYYASDNFDLYRIGSGLESLHYDSIRSDLEPQDHLQRSESNDPIRSPLNSLGSYSKPNARTQFAKQYTSTTEANPPPEPEKPKPALRNKQQSRKPSGFSAPLNFDSQSTKKAIDYKVNTYAANTYAPTTYSPVTKKFNNNRVYYDKSTTLAAKSVQYAETDSTKSAKKATYFKSFQNGNFESSTKSYEFEKSSVAGLGFSPSSVNHLAENVRSTTPTPRRSAVAVTTYNPNNFNVNSHLSQNKAIQQKTTSYQNPSTKQYQTTYSTTAKFFEETTTRPKITKKNDYDYAYYDNVEYDNLELEHVTSNKESVKIA
ncbi:hypothetical protein QAD02_008484 [Eretmocerus hayati]|uniref:Uncharacterized protein n=1 Tax=Eretmocerus hayati TaxID=131215 RepID=A0ACC2N8Y8_9HYME|nr:hypothetical protein QAD02_008484 [Eretmocerus hayati]